MKVTKMTLNVPCVDIEPGGKEVLDAFLDALQSVQEGRASVVVEHEFDDGLVRGYIKLPDDPRPSQEGPRGN